MILPEHEANRLMAEAGIPVIPLHHIGNLEDLSFGVSKLGYPVVLKLSSARHTHKTEAGLVHLNLASRDAVEEAYRDLQGRRAELDPEGVIILEPMAEAGAELFLGVQDHPQFGLVMSFGLGGIWLELNPDVTFRLLPVERYDLSEMLDELKTWPRLQKGFRHLPPVGREQMIDLMGKVADVILSRRAIQELDLNPIVVGRGGPVVVDATVVTGSI
jgi:succinyl-CoA synthetase beta subunit